jgi:proteic killer suppression protein
MIALCNLTHYTRAVIKTFSHRGLERFFRDNDLRGINAQQSTRINRILDRLDVVPVASDMDIPGWNFHELKGERKGDYAVKVSGNWRITFKFEAGDAWEVNLEDYH